ncbi:Uncharacterised protein [Burkholderia pseudomallei]|nr:Uncharacterised protein [Burkholderia pseudomallei]
MTRQILVERFEQLACAVRVAACDTCRRLAVRDARGRSCGGAGLVNRRVRVVQLGMRERESVLLERRRPDQIDEQIEAAQQLVVQLVVKKRTLRREVSRTGVSGRLHIRVDHRRQLRRRIGRAISVPVVGTREVNAVERLVERIGRVGARAGGTERQRRVAESRIRFATVIARDLEVRLAEIEHQFGGILPFQHRWQSRARIKRIEQRRRNFADVDHQQLIVLEIRQLFVELLNCGYAIRAAEILDPVFDLILLVPAPEIRRRPDLVYHLAGRVPHQKQERFPLGGREGRDLNHHRLFDGGMCVLRDQRAGDRVVQRRIGAPFRRDAVDGKKRDFACSPSFEQTLDHARLVRVRRLCNRLSVRLRQLGIGEIERAPRKQRGRIQLIEVVFARRAAGRHDPDHIGPAIPRIRLKLNVVGHIQQVIRRRLVLEIVKTAADRELRGRQRFIEPHDGDIGGPPAGTQFKRDADLPELRNQQADLFFQVRVVGGVGCGQRECIRPRRTHANQVAQDIDRRRLMSEVLTVRGENAYLVKRIQIVPDFRDACTEMNREDVLRSLRQPFDDVIQSSHELSPEVGPTLSGKPACCCTSRTTRAPMPCLRFADCRTDRRASSRSAES